MEDEKSPGSDRSNKSSQRRVKSQKSSAKGKGLSNRSNREKQKMMNRVASTEDELRLLHKLKKEQTLEYSNGLKLKVNQMDSIPASISPVKSKLPDNQFFSINANVLPKGDSNSSDDLKEEEKEEADQGTLEVDINDFLAKTSLRSNESDVKKDEDLDHPDKVQATDVENDRNQMNLPLINLTLGPMANLVKPQVTSSDKLVIGGMKKLRESKTQDYPMDINQQIESNAAKSPLDTSPHETASPIYDQRPSTGNQMPSSNNQKNQMNNNETSLGSPSPIFQMKPQLQDIDLTAANQQLTSEQLAPKVFRDQQQIIDSVDNQRIQSADEMNRKPQQFNDKHRQDASPVQSNRSIHTKANMSKSVVATSQDNADLANDCGEFLLTRNDHQNGKHRQNHTITNGQSIQKAEILKVNRIVKKADQSINMTDLKSFKAGSDYSKHNALSSRAKDNLLEQEENYLNRDQTLNTEALIAQSQVNSTNQLALANVSPLGMTAADPSQTYVANQEHHGKRLKSSNKKQQIQNQRNKLRQQVTMGSPRQRESLSPRGAQQAENSSRKPLKFGKSPVVQNKAQAFTSQLKKPEDIQRRHNSLANTHTNMAHFLKTAAGFTPTMALVGKGTGQSNQLFKKQAAKTSSNFVAFDGSLPNVDVKGLIGKNQQLPKKSEAAASSQSVYNQFRPAKIKKSNRKLLATSLTPLKSDKLLTTEGGLSSQQLKDGLAQMTPMSVITNVRFDMQHPVKVQDQNQENDYDEQDLVEQSQSELELKQEEDNLNSQTPYQEYQETPLHQQREHVVNYNASRLNQTREPSTAYRGNSDLRVANDIQNSFMRKNQLSTEKATAQTSLVPHEILKSKVHMSIQTPHEDATNMIKVRELTTQLQAYSQKKHEMQAVKSTTMTDQEHRKIIDMRIAMQTSGSMEPRHDTQLLPENKNDSINIRSHSSLANSFVQQICQKAKLFEPIGEEAKAEERSMVVDTGEHQQRNQQEFDSNKKLKKQETSSTIVEFVPTDANNAPNFKTEESKETSQKDNENETTAKGKVNLIADHEQFKKILLTSATHKEKRNDEIHPQGSGVESSIINIDAKNQASLAGTGQSSQPQLVYAERLLQTQSSEYVTIRNIRCHTNSTVDMMKTKRTGSLGSDPEQVQANFGILPFQTKNNDNEAIKVDQFGGGLLENSNSKSNRDDDEMQAEGFESVDNKRLDSTNENDLGHFNQTAGQIEQDNEGQATIAQVPAGMSSAQQPREKALVSAEHVIEPISTGLAMYKANEKMLQYTERPQQLSKIDRDENSSVTGTNQNPTYLMSNRYSNRESMNKGGLQESGNQSISFGAGNQKLQSSAQLTRERVASQESVKQSSKSPKKYKKQQNDTMAKKSTKLSNPRDMKHFKQASNSGSVSLFKKSKGSKNHSSISPTPNSKGTTSPVREFKIDQVKMSDASTPSNNPHTMSSDQHTIEQNDKILNLQLPIEVQDQQPSKKQSIAGIDGLSNSSMNYRVKQMVQWQSTDAMKEYGYFDKRVKQFDQLPISSSGISSARMHDGPPQAQDSIKNYATSPELMQNNSETTKNNKNTLAEIQSDSQNEKPSSGKYAELLEMQDPVQLEDRLKSILQAKKQHLQVQDNSTITIKKNHEIDISNQEDTLLGEGTLRNVDDTRKSGLSVFSKSNVFDHNSNQPTTQQNTEQSNRVMSGRIMLSSRGEQSLQTSQANQAYHNLVNAPTQEYSSRSKGRKPRTAGGTGQMKHTSALLSGIQDQRMMSKKKTVFEKLPKNMKGSTLLKPSTAVTESQPVSARFGSLARTQTTGLFSGGSDKNMLATKVNDLQRQLLSGGFKSQGQIDRASSDLDIVGTNPMHKFKNQSDQIQLMKQMKIILDPQAHSVTLYRAGCTFYQLLFGENIEPTETEVSQIVHFICTNPSIPLENLIQLSAKAADTKREQDEADVNLRRTANPVISRDQMKQKRVGFGRTISQSQTGKHNNAQKDEMITTDYFSHGGWSTKKTPQQESQGAPRSKRIFEEHTENVRRSMKLNAISRKMIDSHKKKKEHLNTYKTKILTRQIEELRQSLAPRIYQHSRALSPLSKLPPTGSISALGGAKTCIALTPARSTGSQCTTFDNVSPMRGATSHSPQGGFIGSNTYVTQMAQVDMNNLKQKNEERNDQIVAAQNNHPDSVHQYLQRRSHSQSELLMLENNNQNHERQQNNDTAAQVAQPKKRPPLPPSIQSASKLSQLMTGNDFSNGMLLKNYQTEKQRRRLAAKLDDKSRKKTQTNIISRMVPREKAKLTEMLHQYISAHKLKSASASKSNGGSNAAFTLVTGQSEAIKTEYSAITMHPKEQVNQLLKYRDELRKLARESNMIRGDQDKIKMLIASAKNSNSQNMIEMQGGGQHFVQGETAEDIRRQKIMNQFRTIEKIKQMETGTRQIMPNKMMTSVKSQKVLETKTDLNKISTIGHRHPSQMLNLAGDEFQSMPLLPQLRMVNNTELAHEGDQLELDNDQGITAQETIEADQKLIKKSREEALTKHYETIERDVNQEPAMIYKKNNLLLEKIILDRALNKVQKRRFIHSNLKK